MKISVHLNDELMAELIRLAQSCEVPSICYDYNNGDPEVWIEDEEAFVLAKKIGKAVTVEHVIQYILSSYLDLVSAIAEEDAVG